MGSFVLCARDKVNGGNDFGVRLGALSYLEIPDSDSKPQPKHRAGGASAWFGRIVDQAKAGVTQRGDELDVVFFVHGYNNTADESLKRQRLVETELAKRGYSCIVVGFDWPTAGNALAYDYDRFEAQNAAMSLLVGAIIPFTKFNQPDCLLSIHIIVHSMGAFVLREAFRLVDKKRDATLSNDWSVGQVVLFAGDISSECFAINHPDMLPVFNHCGRLTNYYSGYDSVLAVSNVKNIDINSRVGRVGMPADTPASDKAVDVDCGPRYVAVPNRKLSIIDGILSHSWYLEDDVWYDDLRLTLEGHIDRNSINTRSPGTEVNDFKLNTQRKQ